MANSSCMHIRYDGHYWPFSHMITSTGLLNSSFKFSFFYQIKIKYYSVSSYKSSLSLKPNKCTLLVKMTLYSRNVNDLRSKVRDNNSFQRQKFDVCYCLKLTMINPQNHCSRPKQWQIKQEINSCYGSYDKLLQGYNILFW